jgi:hypothetical protein
MKHVIFGLAAALLVTSGAAFAQGPPGGMPPEIQKMMGEFQKMRNSPKGKLSTTLRALGEFGGDPKTKPTKPQAAKILSLISPWKGKMTMSQDEAATLNKQIAGTFTIPQIKKQATMGAQQGGGMGGGRPGGGMGGGRPGGGGPGGGGFDPKKMMDGLKKAQSANPLNPASYPDSPWKQRMVDSTNKLFGMLQATAK